MKDDGECAIADLGLAVKYQSAKDYIDLPSKIFCENYIRYNIITILIELYYTVKLIIF